MQQRVYLSKAESWLLLRVLEKQILYLFRNMVAHGLQGVRGRRINRTYDGAYDGTCGGTHDDIGHDDDDNYTDGIDLV
jgi:hypothetical protein